MRPDRDVVALADQVDELVRRVRNDGHLGVLGEEARHDLADRELHRRDARCAPDRPARFAQSWRMAVSACSASRSVATAWR